jgi:hypothetical protein
MKEGAKRREDRDGRAREGYITVEDRIFEGYNWNIRWFSKSISRVLFLPETERERERFYIFCFLLYWTRHVGSVFNYIL